MKIYEQIYNVYVKQKIQEIKERLDSQNIRVTVEVELIQMLRFANDITLVTKNGKEMASVLKERQRNFEEYDLKINWKILLKLCYAKKTTETQTQNSKKKNNHPEQVHSYKYLGSLSLMMARILRNLKLDSAIKNRIYEP